MTPLNRTLLTLGAALLSAGFMGCAEADVLAGPYAGANIGLLSRYELSCEAGATCDRNARLSGKVYGGYAFEPLGVEATFFSIGTAQGSLPQGPALLPGRLRSSGLALQAVLPLRFGDFALKGKLGVAQMRSNSTVAGVSSGRTATSPALGTSFAYAISKSVSLNADWDQLRVKQSHESKTRVNLYSVGLSYHF